MGTLLAAVEPRAQIVCRILPNMSCPCFLGASLPRASFAHICISRI